MSEIPEVIDCVECGGAAHRIGYLPDAENLPSELTVTYRCSDCMDRFDLVWADDD